MRKVLLILTLLFLYTGLKAQNTALDLTVIGGGVIYQKLAPNANMDNVLHFWGGYFGCNALQTVANKINMPIWAKKVAPPAIMIGALITKELIDGQWSKSDFNAGLAGCGLSIIKFNIKIK